MRLGRGGIRALVLIAALPVAVNAAPVVLRSDSEIALVTTQPLSSKTNVKGDLVALETAEAVSVDGKIVIPQGTKAVGQITEARAKGALGMTGRLTLRPLYVRVGDKVVRLAGAMKAKGDVDPAAYVGIAFVGGISGRSGNIPAGSPLTARVEKDVLLEAIDSTR